MGGGGWKKASGLLLQGNLGEWGNGGRFGGFFCPDKKVATEISSESNQRNQAAGGLEWGDLSGFLFGAGAGCRCWVFSQVRKTRESKIGLVRMSIC